jgi:hypothetical protein
MDDNNLYFSNINHVIDCMKFSDTVEIDRKRIESHVIEFLGYWNTREYMVIVYRDFVCIKRRIPKYEK